MPTQPNPDTHCTSCGEVLSIYDHCWHCHWPPMDPNQDRQQYRENGTLSIINKCETQAPAATQPL